MLSAVWELRTRRLATGAQFDAVAVGRDFTAAVRRLVRADWLRATTDITDMQGVRRSWFPAVEGRRQPSVVDFEAAWCAGSVVAHVTRAPGGQRPRVEFRLRAPAADDLA
jgi:hypothetical protein